MDISDRYIKMCAESEELQNIIPRVGDNYHFNIGDYYVGKNKYNNVYICINLDTSGNRDIIIRTNVKNYCYPIWLPRQDQIQELFLKGCSDAYKIKLFSDWLESKATYNPHTYTLEQLWLMFYMYEVYKKEWNAVSNIQKWEEIRR